MVVPVSKDVGLYLDFIANDAFDGKSAGVNLGIDMLNNNALSSVYRSCHVEASLALVRCRPAPRSRSKPYIFTRCLFYRIRSLADQGG
jgi:hypothetical protein